MTLSLGCESLEPIGEALQEAAPVARAVPGGGGEALYWLLGGLGTVFLVAGKVWHSKTKKAKSN